MRFSSAILLALLSGLAFVPQAVAQQACTEMGCTNGLSIDMAPEVTAEKGMYEFRFVLDGKRAECKGILPLKNCEDGPSFTCSTRQIRINESGCALPDNEHTVTGLQIDGRPRKVIMSIRHGAMNVTRTFRPVYLKVAPNGPGCGPVCIQAREQLSFSHSEN